MTLSISTVIENWLKGGIGGEHFLWGGQLYFLFLGIKRESKSLLKMRDCEVSL